MKSRLALFVGVSAFFLAGQATSYAGSKIGAKKKIGLSGEDSLTRKNKAKVGLTNEERKRTYTGFSGSRATEDRTLYSVVRVRTKGKDKLDVWVVLKKDRIQLRNKGKAPKGLKNMIQKTNVDTVKISIKGRDNALKFAQQYLEKLPEEKRGQVSLVTKAGKKTAAEEVVPAGEEE